MPVDVKLSHTAAMILQTIAGGSVYGFSVMERTGLPSGTVYPAMRRLERDGLIRSEWEKGSVAEKEMRPARRYYKVTAGGRTALVGLLKRYPLLELLRSAEVEVKQR